MTLCTVLYYFLSVALHVSGVTHAHHQELNLNCIHSIWVDKRYVSSRRRV
jgi:hypothetical protein